MKTEKQKYMVNVTFRTALNHNDCWLSLSLMLSPGNKLACSSTTTGCPIPPTNCAPSSPNIPPTPVPPCFALSLCPTLQLDLSGLLHGPHCKGLSILPAPGVLPTQGPLCFPHVCTGCSSASQTWPSKKYPSMFFKPAAKNPMGLQREVTRKITQEATHTALSRSKCLFTSASHLLSL